MGETARERHRSVQIDMGLNAEPIDLHVSFLELLARASGL